MPYRNTVTAVLPIFQKEPQEKYNYNQIRRRRTTSTPAAAAKPEAKGNSIAQWL
jgi:hypothetical protein